MRCSLQRATSRCRRAPHTSIMVTTGPKSSVGDLQKRVQIAPRCNARERMCIIVAPLPPFSRVVWRVLLRNHSTAVFVVVVVVVVFWLQFLCFKMLAVMTVIRPREITSVEKLHRKFTVKVVTAVVVLTEEAFEVTLKMLTWPTLETVGKLEEVGIMQLVVMPLMAWPVLGKGSLEEVGIKKVTAVVVVTKKTAVIVMTVL